MLSAQKTIKRRNRVVLTRDVDYLPYAMLRAGETGTVIATEEDAMGVWRLEVLMDTIFPSLAAWSNEVLFEAAELSAVALLVVIGAHVAGEYDLVPMLSTAAA